MNWWEGLSRHEFSRQTLDQARRKIPRNSPAKNAPPVYCPVLRINAGVSYPLLKGRLADASGAPTPAPYTGWRG